MASGRELLLPNGLVDAWGLLKTVVGQVAVAVLLLVLVEGLALDQVLQLALGQFGGGVSAVGWPDLLAGAHVEQTLVHLVDLVGREVHVLAVLQQLVERLLL